MGIPGFFKWLIDKYHYPDIVRPCIEYEPFYDEHGAYQALDETQRNPNGIEFDNLYLDMNGIIHICANSDNCLKPKNEDEIIKSIFDSIDRIFSIVRPRKLLYMAIDGAAPRAKLNQQRSRRFLEYKDAQDKVEEIENVKRKILANNGLLPEDSNQKGNIEPFDENCITPGTLFLSNLIDCLRYYIYNRMNTNSAWQSIKIILSDSNVPGEGEHKIMDFIRQQRVKPDYDPNTRHVLYGSDADLIVLGLATHENYINIIRDEFNLNKPRLCEICHQIGHDIKECKGISKGNLDQNNTSLSPTTSNNIKTKYIFADLSILRKKLLEFLSQYDQSQFKWNFERFIDDWVFICLLVGNDFLPNLPSLEIYENVIDELLSVYSSMVPQFNDYLTDNGKLNINLLKTILIEIGKNEDKKFQNRHKVNQQYQNNSQPINLPMKPPLNLDEIKSIREKPMPLAFKPSYNFQRPDSSTKKPIEVKMQSSTTQSINSHVTISSNNQQNDRYSNEIKGETSNLSASNQQEFNDPNDPVRLWEKGWHERYYQSKFDKDTNHLDEFCTQIIQDYVEGLCWVLQYYYQGVPSWDWFYPHYYAPFASDFSNLKNISIKFNKNSKPFKPLEQLISLLPPQCAKYLPERWQSLILEKDSPIIDFYPTSFPIDPNGKRYKNQYIAKLPFIDEKRLHKVLENNYSSLTSEEKKRNQDGCNLLFIHSNHSSYNQLREKFDMNRGENESLNIPITPVGKTVKAPIHNYINISNNQVMCVKYCD